ncbi:MAG: tetratricopeptide repeat protein [Planctomycetota bacterium]
MTHRLLPAATVLAAAVFALASLLSATPAAAQDTDDAARIAALEARLAALTEQLRAVEQEQAFTSEELAKVRAELERERDARLAAEARLKAIARVLAGDDASSDTPDAPPISKHLAALLDIVDKAVAAGHTRWQALVELPGEQGQLARAGLDQAIDASDGDAPAEYFYLRGVLRHLEGDVPGALADLQRDVELEPDYAPSHLALARVYAAVGRYAEALKTADRALQINPSLVEALGLRASLRLSLGDLQQAGQDASAALQLEPDNVEALQVRASVRHGSGDYAGAVADLSRIVQLAPDNPRAWHTLASDRVALGQLNEAMTAINRAIELQPAPESLSLRGSLHLSAGRAKDALEDFVRAVRMDPDRWEYLANRGTAQMQTGDTPGAVESFSAAYLRCHDPERRKMLAKTIETLGGRVPE